MWLLIASILASPWGCFAAETDAALTVQLRDRWGRESGFPPGPVYAIAQGKDGYLWIGTEQGLVRFDGQSFRLIENFNAADTVRPVIGLTAVANGDLWVRPRRPSILRFRRGTFDNPLVKFGRPNPTVASATQSADGSILVWMLKGEPRAAVFSDERFQTVSAPAGFSRSPVLSLAHLPNGEIWVGTRDAGLFRLQGNQSTPITRGLPDLKVNCVLPTPSGEIWIGTDDGLVRWNRRELTTAEIPTPLRRGRILSLARDRHANLWIGTNSNGLIKLDSHGHASYVDDANGFDAVTALFEDREGSIWIGRANRLERLRNAPFVTLESTKGTPIGAVSPGDGGVWAAPLNGGLRFIKGSSSRRFSEAGLDTEVVISLASSTNELWVGRRNGELTHLQLSAGGVSRAVTYGRSHRLPGNAVSAVHRSRSGAVWAGTIGGGLVRLDSNGLTVYTTESGIASNVITSITETPDGWTWFATPRGLSGLAPDGWHTFSSAKELPSCNITSLYADRTGTLWIGTVGGLAIRRSGRIESLATVLGDSILGMAEDRLGWMWISTSSRVLRVDRKRLAAGLAMTEDFWSYGRSDGLVGAEGIRRERSIMADASGQIWLGSRDGVSMFDPGEGGEAGVSAVVDIHAVSADGETLDVGQAVRIPPLHRRIRIGYAGLNLSAPGRVRFRYRMDPFDVDWSEPLATREAVYTNLTPGEYKFRVLASNSNGEWNGEEASIRIAVQPALWQTFWFKTFSVLIAASTILVLYRRRLQQVAVQMNIRFEERLAERTRIAQELHDTLLQGFLSASMQLHLCADRLAENSDIKPQLDRVLKLMTQVIDEGRNAVRGLRSSRSASLDLEEAFSKVKDELQGETELCVVAVGTPRRLHSILRDEVYRIGREAIVNAFRHSGATRIEATVEYTARTLKISVRDNGCGIDPAVLEYGRDGHWGLCGMRERAEQIGGRFRVWSSETSGTEVELEIPGKVAFLVTSPARSLKWLGKLSVSMLFRNGRHR